MINSCQDWTLRCQKKYKNYHEITKGRNARKKIRSVFNTLKLSCFFDFVALMSLCSIYPLCCVADFVVKMTYLELSLFCGLYGSIIDMVFLSEIIL